MKRASTTKNTCIAGAILCWTVVALPMAVVAAEPATPLELGLEKLVSPKDVYSNFSTYGTSPESPSRKRLAYTRFPKTPTTPDKTQDAEIWVCDLEGLHAVKFTDVKNIDPHNGARFDWINDGTLAYFDDFHTKVRNLDVKLLFDKPGYPGEQSFGDFVLVFQPELEAADDGLYLLNVKTGDYRAILKRDELMALRRGRLTHPRMSPDGKRIGFEQGEHFYSVGLDVGSPPLHQGPAAMHWLWYDADSVVGHTSTWSNGTHYALDGTNLGIVCGLGNHLAIAPGGKLLASDSNYGSNPVVMRIHRLGDMKGTTVFSSPFSDVVWKTTKAHSDPSFARDGSRIYYCKSTGPGLIQAFYREIRNAN